MCTQLKCVNLMTFRFFFFRFYFWFHIRIVEDSILNDSCELQYAADVCLLPSCHHTNEKNKYEENKMYSTYK